MGAGVGGEARELYSFSTSTVWKERQRSCELRKPSAALGLCGPKHPAPAEHVGITYSMGPHPGSQEETRTISPSLVTSWGSDPAPFSNVGSEVSSVVPGDSKTWVLCW